MRFLNFFAKPAPENDPPFLPHTPKRNAPDYFAIVPYQPPAPQSSLFSFFSRKSPEPTYVRLSLTPTTPEQDALLARADALHAKHLARTEDSKQSEKTRTVSEKKLAILNQCIYLLTEPTCDNNSALLSEKETQLKEPINYTYNDGWSGYIGAKNDTNTLIEEVIAWASKLTFDSGSEQLEMASPLHPV